MERNEPRGSLTDAARVRLDGLDAVLGGGEVSTIPRSARMAVSVAVLLATLTVGLFVPTTPAIRAVLVVLAVGAAALAVVLKRPGNLQRFVLGSATPVDLAMIRIVVFGMLLGLRAIREATVFSQLPSALVVPPMGLGSIASYASNPGLVRVLSIGFLVASGLAMVGWRTRSTALIAVLLGVFALGVPQFFGKVNHYHHLLWIAAILAVSRSGDALSADAWLQARRRADAGSVEPPKASIVYGLPLRCIWLLMSVVYFFPGFWKLVTIGPEWALGDNLRNQMWNKWAELGDWEPLFRIDSFPVLYRSAGLFTLAFEIFFVVLILTPVLRRVALVSGLAFHNGTATLMGIPFWHLQAMYVSLVNWDRLFRWVGSRAFAEPVVVSYDHGEVAQRRIVARLLAFDVLGGIHGQRLEWNRGPRGPNDAEAILARDLRSGENLRPVLRRLPVLWPLLLLPRRGIRRLLSGAAAGGGGPRSHRQHSPPDADGLPRDARVDDRLPRDLVRELTLVSAVGGLLLLAATGAGLTRTLNGWPIAMYPTFAYEAPAEATEIIVDVRRADGKVEPVARSDLDDVIGPERLTPLLLHIAEAADHATARSRLQGLLTLMELGGDAIEDIESVRIRRLRVVTRPDQRGRPPLGEEVLRTVDLTR